MLSITIHFADGTKRNWEAVGNKWPFLKLIGYFVTVVDVYGTELTYPASLIQYIEEVPAPRW